MFFQQDCFSAFRFGSIASKFKVSAGTKLVLRGGLTCTEGMIEFLTPTVNSLVGSGTLSFNNGILKSDNNFCTLTGALSTSTAQLITLNNGGYVTFASPTALSQNVTVASSATVTINGNPIFSSTVPLGNASSVVQMNINSILNQAVTGLGKLRLLSDLVMSKNVALPPQVDLNGCRLTLQGGTYSSAVTFSGSSIGGNLVCLAYTNLTQSWTIGSAGESYTLSGNGNILELSGSGNIIFNGADLTISNIVIKGLSSSNMLRGSGEIKFNNVALQLAGNFTRSDGKYTVVGGNAKIITNNYTITMSGSGNDFKVDGAFLLYEQLNTSVTTVPVTNVSGAAITKLNGGDIVSIYSPAATGVGGSSIVISSAANTLSQSYFVTPAGTFQVNNATPASPLSVNIDGTGHFIHFPYKTGSYFILQNNVQLSLTNLVLTDFYPSAISLGTSSSITFGDGVLVQLGPDLTIGASDMSWTFTGNSIIDGNGATLTLNKSGAITIDNNKTLTLKNLRLLVSVTDAFKALNSNSKIRLQNVELVVLNQGFNYSLGSLEIADFVKFIADTGAAINPVNFEFSSTGTMTVLASSELSISAGINFKYNANPAGDTTLYASKRHFSLAQIGSKLSLNGCSIQTTDTGLAFDQGTLQIYDKVSVVTTSSVGADFEIGSGVQVNLGASALLNVMGSVFYSE